jgi:hypothetical protein
MSTLETNSIGKYSGNNVSIDDALNLKSYTTAQRDALTSVAGDMIYNSTTARVEHYNGSSWAAGLAAVQIQYVIVGGGGSGPTAYGSANIAGGGGGAGGYISSVIGENSGGGLSAHQTMYVAPSTNYPVSIGAGGAGYTSGTRQDAGLMGTGTYFNNITAEGGGGGQSYVEPSHTEKVGMGGSGGGRGSYYNRPGASTTGPDGITGQGYKGGNSQLRYNGAANAAGGGGGASAAGGNGSSNNGGNGGAGVTTSISGSPVTYAGGGGGGAYSTQGTGGAGGGADGVRDANGNAGTANTGGGAGGIYITNTAQRYGGNGGSGIVILRYPNTYTISQTGLTLTTATVGDDKVTTITAGTGTVSWS